MKIAVFLVVAALMGQGAYAPHTTRRHFLFLDGCVLFGTTIYQHIPYSGPPPLAGWKDCVITNKDLLMCIDLNDEKDRRIPRPVDCPANPVVNYCPAVKGATWGFLCDKNQGFYYSSSSPMGYKYCTGNSYSIDACALVKTPTKASFFSLGTLRGAVDEATQKMLNGTSEGEERPMAKFLDEAETGEDMVKGEEKTTFPLLNPEEPLHHCIFKDGAMMGCRQIDDQQYKDKIPYAGFSGIFFGNDGQTRGYIPAIPTITGMQFGLASVFQYFTDNFFLSSAFHDPKTI